MENALGLSADISARLSRLIYAARFWGGSANPGGPPWAYGVPSEIDEFPEIKNPERYVVDRALSIYDPELPVWNEARSLFLIERRQGGRTQPGVLADVLPRALDDLREAGFPNAERELLEAFRDLVRHPGADRTGAIHHAMCVVEAVIRQVVGDGSGLGDLLRRHRGKTGLPPGLERGLEKFWGFASESARHGSEGHLLSFAEAELTVTMAAGIVRFLCSIADVPPSPTAQPGIVQNATSGLP